jgi:hypothetical protein
LLACDKVFVTVLEAIGNFDKTSKTPNSTLPTQAPSPEPETPVSPSELPEDPIKDEPIFVEIPTQEPAQAATETPHDDTASPCVGKKPSVFARCGILIKYLYMAQFQQPYQEKLTQDLIPIVNMQPTMVLAHKACSVIHHIQARVNQAASNPTGDNISATTDPTHLFDKVTMSLKNIKACLAGLAEKVGNSTTLDSSTKTGLQKLQSLNHL